MAVEFYTPFLVHTKQTEIDDIGLMLAEWKEQHLSGWYLQLWTQIEERDAAPRKRRTLGWIKLAVKWFWPLLTLILLANVLSGSSIFFLALALVPAQLLLTLLLILKIVVLTCLVSAYLLEKEHNARE
jgi:hypothetical protein